MLGWGLYPRERVRGGGAVLKLKWGGNANEIEM